jgi:hypothetical protein
VPPTKGAGRQYKFPLCIFSEIHSFLPKFYDETMDVLFQKSINFMPVILFEYASFRFSACGHCPHHENAF